MIEIQIVCKIMIEYEIKLSIKILRDNIFQYNRLKILYITTWYKNENFDC